MKRTQISRWLQVSVVGSLTLAGCAHNAQQVASMQAKQQPKYMTITDSTASPMIPLEAAPSQAENKATAAATPPAVPVSAPHSDQAQVAIGNVPSIPAQSAGSLPADAGIQLVSHDQAIPPGTPVPTVKPVVSPAENVPADRSPVTVKPSPNFGHAEDYSWLRGQVEYSRLSNGWRLRYATMDETDSYGGCVTLSGDSSLQRLQDGQYIQVQGHFCNAEDKGTSPPYRADSFEIIQPMK